MPFSARASHHCVTDNAVGVGLRDAHVGAFASGAVPVAFVEIHAENYFDRAGLAAEALSEVAARHPISVHGVAASLGSPQGVDLAHLEHLSALVASVDPVLVSEHLAWSRVDGVYLNDLLPLPLTDEALTVVADNVSRVQDRLGRQILVENPARYVAFSTATLEEPEFLGELTHRTGCGLLLDVNNLFVSAHNLGFDASAYVVQIPADTVGEIHLAGYERSRGAHDLLVDTHSCRVASGVWRLYEDSFRRLGPCPTLIEWDSELPTLDDLLAEARCAEACIARAVAAP